MTVRVVLREVLRHRIGECRAVHVDGGIRRVIRVDLHAPLVGRTVEPGLGLGVGEDPLPHELRRIGRRSFDSERRHIALRSGGQGGEFGVVPQEVGIDGDGRGCRREPSIRARRPGAVGLDVVERRQIRLRQKLGDQPRCQVEMLDARRGDGHLAGVEGVASLGKALDVERDHGPREGQRGVDDRVALGIDERRIVGPADDSHAGGSRRADDHLLTGLIVADRAVRVRRRSGVGAELRLPARDRSRGELAAGDPSLVGTQLAGRVDRIEVERERNAVAPHLGTERRRDGADRLAGGGRGGSRRRLSREGRRRANTSESRRSRPVGRASPGRSPSRTPPARCRPGMAHCRSRRRRSGPRLLVGRVEVEVVVHPGDGGAAVRRDLAGDERGVYDGAVDGRNGRHTFPVSLS